MAELATAGRAASAEWFRCPSCSAFVYHKRLRRNLGVCPDCNHHFRLRIRERLGQLLDEDSFQELSEDLEIVDALSFADSKPYVERIAQAQKKSETKTGALHGTGTIDGLPIVVAGIDFSLHRRQHGRRGGRGDHARRRARPGDAHAAARDLRLRRRAHAGGRACR